MKHIKEDYEVKDITSFLNENLNSERMDEGWLSTAAKAIKPFLKKAISYLSFKCVKLKHILVAYWNDEVLPAIAPACTQLVLQTLSIKSPVNYVGTKEDQAITGNKTTYDDCITSRGTTMQMWETTYNKLKGQLAEGEIEFPKPFLTETEHIYNLDLLMEALGLNHPDVNFASSNVDGPMFEKLVEVRLKKPTTSRPLLVWGAPGIGKTSIVKAVVKRVGGKGARLIDCPLSQKTEADFTLPSYVYDEDGKKIGAEDLPKTWLPVYKVTGDKKKDAAADKATGSGILFFDEITRSNEAVQNIALKIIGERKFGDDYAIGSGWGIIAAANRMEDDPNTNRELGRALGNRFMQVNYSPSFKSWRKWAETQGYISQDILDWLENNEKYFYWQDEDGESTLYATPRSWAWACEELCNMQGVALEEGFDLMSMDKGMMEMIIASYVGAEPAKAFMQFIRLKESVDLNALRNVWKDGKKAPLPKTKGRSDLGYIFTSTIVAAMKHEPSTEEFSNFVDYLIRLKDESLMARAFHMIVTMYPEMNKKFGEADLQGKKEWDKYAEPINRLCAAYPEFDAVDAATQIFN